MYPFLEDIFIPTKWDPKKNNQNWSTNVSNDWIQNNFLNVMLKILFMKKLVGIPNHQRKFQTVK